jgi:hypothetical protein
MHCQINNVIQKRDRQGKGNNEKAKKKNYGGGNLLKFLVFVKMPK